MIHIVFKLKCSSRTWFALSLIACILVDWPG